MCPWECIGRSEEASSNAKRFPWQCGCGSRPGGPRDWGIRSQEGMLVSSEACAPAGVSRRRRWWGAHEGRIRPGCSSVCPGQRILGPDARLRGWRITQVTDIPLAVRRSWQGIGSTASVCCLDSAHISLQRHASALAVLLRHGHAPDACDVSMRLLAQGSAPGIGGLRPQLMCSRSARRGVGVY